MKKPSFFDSIKFLTDDEPTLWASLKDLNEEINGLAPVILSADSSADVSVTIISQLSRTEDQWGFPPVHTILKKHKGTLYLVAVNGFSEEIEEMEFEISLVGASAFKSSAISVLEEPEREIQTSISPGVISFEDGFEELGVRVYRIPLLGDFVCPDGVEINDLAVLVDQWLQSGAWCADIAPVPNGDGIVNMLDFAALAENWLEGSW